MLRKQLSPLRFLLLSVAGGWATLAAGATLRIEKLQCEWVDNPIAVDSATPVLSWQVQADANGVEVDSIEIEVASRLPLLEGNGADLWRHSSKRSDDLFSVVYRGRPLTPGQVAHWRVRARSRDGVVSAWSAPARWGLGIYKAEEWEAEWIGASAQKAVLGSQDQPVWLFHRNFEVMQVPERAVLYLAAAGFSDVWLNGKSVSDGALEPALTDLRRRVGYRAYNVSALLKPGRNTIGVRLGNGYVNIPTRSKHWRGLSPWAMAPRFLLSLQGFAGGRREVLCASGGDWKRATGEIVYNCIFGGERIDRRQARDNWLEWEAVEEPGWQPAVPLQAPNGSLSALTIPLCRVVEEIPAVSLKVVRSNLFVADMGTNFTGWVRVAANGRPGQEVVVRISERLGTDGSIDRKASNPLSGDGPFHEVRYIFGREGRAVIEPRFTFVSGQYVEIEGLDYEPALSDVVGRTVHNDFATTGAFSSSSLLLNRLDQQTRRVLLNNWIGMQLDCPHREKTPWLGDYSRTAQAMLFNFAAATAFEKVILDLKDNQRSTGGLAVFVPERSAWPEESIDIWWQGDAWRLPWAHYLYYGDRRILETAYPIMRDFLRLALKQYPDGFTPIGARSTTAPFGDHCSVRYFEERDSYDRLVAAGVPKDEAARVFRTPHHLLGAMGAYDGALTVSRVAGILGFANEEGEFRAVADRIRQRLNHHLDRSTFAYAPDSQTLQALALYFSVPEDPDRPRVLQSLVENIVQRWDGHLSTGTIATRQLFRALCAEGRADLAIQMIHRPGYPGFADMLERGVTAIWERWDGKSSLNHPALGSVVDFFYSNLAGIQPASPGFRVIDFRPELACGLNHVSASYASVLGPVESSWRKVEGGWHHRIRVPVGATGRIKVRSTEAELASSVQGIIPESEANGVTVYKVKSGTYELRWRRPMRPTSR